MCSSPVGQEGEEGVHNNTTQKQFLGIPPAGGGSPLMRRYWAWKERKRAATTARNTTPRRELLTDALSLFPSHPSPDSSSAAGLVLNGLGRGEWRVDGREIQIFAARREERGEKLLQRKKISLSLDQKGVLLVSPVSSSFSAALAIASFPRDGGRRRRGQVQYREDETETLTFYGQFCDS